MAKKKSTEFVPAVLLLEDGTVFRGKSAGKIGTSTGEICFNTGMTGYQEIFTDPSYFGQILVMTNVHIGNYGAADADNESNNVKIAGLVCRNFSEKYSRKIGDSNLQNYLEKQSLVGIQGVDTRELVRKIRSKGAMNALISSEKKSIDELMKTLAQVPSMAGLELASKVSTAEAYDYGDGNASYKIAVMDYGVKENILRCMTERGAKLRVFPAKTPFEDVQEWAPDAYFLSNGPGDPSAMDYAVEQTKKILTTKKPVFGICLGHQILCLSQGVSTYKMHHGHRGSNHPVKNLETGHCEITTQNHGFGVSPEAILAATDVLSVTHKNLNDDTIEGIKLNDQDAFSVQYHPEASPGPHDSRYLFDQFFDLIKQNN